MKPLLAASLFLLPLLAAHPASEKISFDPAEGLSLTKTFTTETAVDLEDLSIVVDGEDMTAMIGELAMEVLAEQTYVVSDEYLSTSDGRPRELQRSFDEITSTSEVSIEVMMNAQDQETSASSELEGTTVLFSWNEEDEDYRVKFVGEGDLPDADLLEDLDVDMDLLDLLPEEAVEEGDSWQIEPEAFASMFMPGGNLHLTPEGGEELDMEEMTEIITDISERAMESLDEWLDGEATCTFDGTRDEGGAEVAVVKIVIEYNLDAEVADLAQEAIDAVLEMQELPVDVEITVDLFQIGGTMSSEGELLWNLAAGHVHSLTLSTDFDVVIDMEITGDADGEGGTVEASMEFSGTMENTVSTD